MGLEFGACPVAVVREGTDRQVNLAGMDRGRRGPVVSVDQEIRLAPVVRAVREAMEPGMASAARRTWAAAVALEAPVLLPATAEREHRARRLERERQGARPVQRARELQPRPRAVPRVRPRPANPGGRLVVRQGRGRRMARQRRQAASQHRLE